MLISFDDPRLPESWWAHVMPDPIGGCWLWTGCVDPAGYAHQHRRGARPLAHAHAYEALVGPIPDGLELDHLCRVRCCVNPAHLEPVTHRENMQRGSRARATHCKWGHAFDDANTYIRPRSGGRDCRICVRERGRARDERNRARG